MNVILFLRRATSAHRIHVSGPLALGAVSLVLVVLLGGAFYAGLHLGERSNAAFAADSPAELRRIAAQQKTEIDRMR